MRPRISTPVSVSPAPPRPPVSTVPPTTTAAIASSSHPVPATGWELDAIAAVVVGGTVLTGGRGGAGLTLAGVLLLGLILNLLNLEGTISPWWQWVVRGVFLLGVVVVQSRVQRSADG